MDLCTAGGVLATAILNRLLKSIWLSLNHIQQRYQVVLPVAYEAA